MIPFPPREAMTTAEPPEPLTNRHIAQNRRFGIDRHIVFDIRMPFAPFDDRPASVLREAQSAQRHTLVKLYARADDGGLTDHHARAVVDEERRADGRAWIDVDSRNGMGVFAHDARNEGNLRRVQFMGDAMDADRLEARIRQDNLVQRLGGRIAVQRRLRVRQQDFTDFRQFHHQPFGDLLAIGEAIVGVSVCAVERKGMRQLGGKFAEDIVHHAADDKILLRRRERTFGTPNPEAAPRR